MKPIIPSSEITPLHVYRTRRQFLREAAVRAAAGAGLGLAACSPPAGPTGTPGVQPTPSSTSPAANPRFANLTDELGDPISAYADVTGFNNFYEFTTHKKEVALAAYGFQASPWEVQVGGLVHKPQTFGVEDLERLFPPEERVYRMRCVEAWSLVIPWMGFPLHKLLNAVEPMGDARYVRFEALHDPERMPGQQSPNFPWPYVEGLRIDEAMHDLTLVATGLYGEPLLIQNGAPLRLVVPWKYGFKSIKAITRIDLVDFRPNTMWASFAPDEYGFYANVNPERNHPRWSQAREMRIGEQVARASLLYNGYAEQVSDLYTGIDLQKEY